LYAPQHLASLSSDPSTTRSISSKPVDKHPNESQAKALLGQDLFLCHIVNCIYQTH